MNSFIANITSSDPNIRNRSFLSNCKRKSLKKLLAELAELEQFRLQSKNLYEGVRASLFLYAAYRFVLPTKAGLKSTGYTPFEGYEHLLNRRFEEAIAVFKFHIQQHGLDGTLASALAEAYHQRAFQMLAEQVRKS
ncbi:MAG: UTP--glucose-1-phosphate uridylyltransferase, partial [Bacteroidota bacterium]